ncbi:MAG: hypothetical protein IPO85_17085 [Saprospiraceae bacterium]|uniref:Uncharacterized protein n=1 Tax=Candidatus Defluviibacterium haderslevense TaxID=2981993 RepID=A0A9D7SCN5_9BACT|nr:hypothetical protein [Candidatus Defluviibacterium haderslevense]
MKLFILFIGIAFFISVGDISMAGIKINDSNASLSKLKLKLVSNENNMTMYKTDNGNDFSITIEKGKVVYMENDWLQDIKSNKPLFSDFYFGQTTLKDIRSKFSTNGFTYRSKGAFTTDTDLIEFNCFEFDSNNNEVLVTITKMSLKEHVTKDNISSKLKLDAIIIADKAYLDKVWGDEKVYDSNYRKI